MAGTMINTIIFGVFNLVLWGGVIYLFVLIVKALKKYINSDKSPKDKERTTERPHEKNAGYAQSLLCSINSLII